MPTNKSYFPIFTVLLLFLAHNSSAQQIPIYYTSPTPTPTPEPEPEPEPQPDPSVFPQSLIDEMSSREMRYHHFLWHNIRDNWNRFDSEMQEEIRDLGWEPPRPSREYTNGTAVALTENDSGEDFFYMHREMIADARKIISDNGESYELTGWKTLPAPGDEDWPVPDIYDVPGNPATTRVVTAEKADDFYYNTLKPMEDRFYNGDALRQMTLGQFGSAMENTVHNWLHLRFSAESEFGYRPGTEGGFPYIDEKWDDPAYSWLADTYSSHVNPIFWKLHVWVDDRIEDWRSANGVDEIEWKGTWLGGPVESLVSVLDVCRGIDDSEEEDQEDQIARENESNLEVEVQVITSENEEGEEVKHFVFGTTSSTDTITKTVDDTGIPACSFADDVQVNLNPIWTTVSVSGAT